MMPQNISVTDLSPLPCPGCLDKLSDMIQAYTFVAYMVLIVKKGWPPLTWVLFTDKCHHIV